MTTEATALLAPALLACRRAGEVLRRHFRRAGLEVRRKADGSPVTEADLRAEEAIREVLRRQTPELGVLGEELGAEGDGADRWIVDPLDGTRNFVAGLPFFAVLVALELGGEMVLGVVHAPLLGPASGSGSGGPGGGGGGETWWAVRGVGAFAGSGTSPEACRRRLAVSGEQRLERAFVTHGGLRHLMAAGLWQPFSRLVESAGRTRGFGDWWGHVLVAEGRCDAMVEAGVALHDVAAVKVIVEEAGGVFLTRGEAPLVAGFRGPVLSCNPHLAPELRRLLEF
jgi:histidinol-phosphatase